MLRSKPLDSSPELDGTNAVLDGWYAERRDAETLGWTRERFVKARDCLEGSHLEMVRNYSKKNGPAWYRWRRFR